MIGTVLKSRKAAIGAGALVVVLAAVGAFVIPGLTGDGSAHKVAHRSTAHEVSRTVSAAGLEFSIPKEWTPMAKSELPATAREGANAKVIAGACVDESGSGTCGVDVTYMLVGEKDAMPGLADMQQYLVQQLPSQLDEVRVLRSDFGRLDEGPRTLEHEIEFRRDGVVWHELVMVFRDNGNGLVVIAAGPGDQYQDHREDVIEQLRAVKIAHEGAGTEH